MAASKSCATYEVPFQPISTRRDQTNHCRSHQLLTGRHRTPSKRLVSSMLDLPVEWDRISWQSPCQLPASLDQYHFPKHPFRSQLLGNRTKQQRTRVFSTFDSRNPKFAHQNCRSSLSIPSSSPPPSKPSTSFASRGCNILKYFRSRNSYIEFLIASSVWCTRFTI
jgi:hypothetical protein